MRIAEGITSKAHLPDLINLFRPWSGLTRTRTEFRDCIFCFHTNSQYLVSPVTNLTNFEIQILIWSQLAELKMNIKKNY